MKSAYFYSVLLLSNLITLFVVEAKLKFRCQDNTLVPAIFSYVCDGVCWPAGFSPTCGSAGIYCSTAKSVPLPEAKLCDESASYCSSNEDEKRCSPLPTTILTTVVPETTTTKPETVTPPQQTTIPINEATTANDVPGGTKGVATTSASATIVIITTTDAKTDVTFSSRKVSRWHNAYFFSVAVACGGFFLTFLNFYQSLSGFVPQMTFKQQRMVLLGQPMNYRLVRLPYRPYPVYYRQQPLYYRLRRQYFVNRRYYFKKSIDYPFTM